MGTVWYGKVIMSACAPDDVDCTTAAATMPDIRAIRNLICEHQEKSEHIDNEVEALMRDVRRLQFQKSQHLEQIRHYQGLITLARRLPPEILAAIFELCAQEGWTRTPLTVSHVCSEWRRAAEIPAVWSYLYVNLDGRDPIGRTFFWLNNARHAPLYLTLEIRGDTSHLPDLMDLLLKFSSQWRTLTINSLLLGHANRTLHLCARSLPQLRAINVTVAQEHLGPAGPTDESDLNGFGAFVDAPNLRMLRITRNILPSSGSIPASITHLSISLPCTTQVTSTLSISATLDLLRGLPLLQDLSVLVPRGQERSFLPAGELTQLVTLSSLTSLTLMGPHDIFGILCGLRTPALLRLFLRSSVDPFWSTNQNTGVHLRQFAETADAPLEFLEIHDLDLPGDDLSSCLSMFSSLKELHLHESEISDAVLEALADSTAMCPQLNGIDFRWCGSISGRSLVNLVQQRFMSSRANEGVEPITMMTVMNCARIGERDIIDIAEFAACRVVMRDTDDYCRTFPTHTYSQAKSLTQRLQDHSVAARTICIEDDCSAVS